MNPKNILFHIVAFPAKELERIKGDFWNGQTDSSVEQKMTQRQDARIEQLRPRSADFNLNNQMQNLNKRVPGSPQEKGKAKKKKEKKGKEEKKDKKEEKKKPASKPHKPAGEEKATILEYMKKQNRPYNALNVHDNLRGAIKKAQVMRLLDELVQEKALVMKEYGKQRIYLYNQAHLPEMSQTEVVAIDQQIEAVKQQIDQLKLANKDLGNALKQAGQVAGVEELKGKIKEMTISNEAMREKMDFFYNEEQALVSEEVMREARERREKMEKKMKMLKRGCLDVVEMLAQGQDKSVKEMMKKLELETD